MRNEGTVLVALLLAACQAAGAQNAPKIETLSDAEIYVKVKTAEMEKQKTAAIDAARAEAERKAALAYQAQLGDMKKQLIEARARAVELERRLDDIMGLLKKGVAASGVSPTPARWGKPVFADDFTEGAISDAWSREGLGEGGQHFEIVDGMLTGKERILIARPFSAKALRVEYDTWTISETPCDASVYVLSAQTDWQLFVGIGSEMNRLCRLNVGGEVLARKSGAFLVRGKRQHIVVEVGERKARVEVDGQVVVQYEGDKVPARLDSVRLALYAFTTGMHFDNVRVHASQ